MGQMELDQRKRTGGLIEKLTGKMTAEGKTNSRVLLISKIGFPLVLAICLVPWGAIL